MEEAKFLGDLDERWTNPMELSDEHQRLHPVVTRLAAVHSGRLAIVIVGNEPGRPVGDGQVPRRITKGPLPVARWREGTVDPEVVVLLLVTLSVDLCPSTAARLDELRAYVLLLKHHQPLPPSQSHRAVRFLPGEGW